jgi:tyrosine-protein phosphatase YwqE
MLNFFRKKKYLYNPFKVDIHSHLLPGLDDGVATFDEALQLIKAFQNIGYKKLITTPHVMSDYYPNREEDILKKLNQLRQAIKSKGLSIRLEAAAEYYLDEGFIEKIEKKEKLLTFGDRFVLFETSFMNEPVFLKETLFQLNTLGYKPVMAHPERYLYLINNNTLIEELQNMNVRFQLNLLSLTGYYSKDIRTLAKKLIDKGRISFMGSDCHNLNQFASLKRVYQEKILTQKAQFGLLNNSL